MIIVAQKHQPIKKLPITKVENFKNTNFDLNQIRKNAVTQNRYFRTLPELVWYISFLKFEKMLRSHGNIKYLKYEETELS